MRPPKEINYEVQVSQNGRWTIDSVHPRKGEALTRAEALFGSGRLEGVKVLEDSGGKPKVLFERSKARAEKPLTISPVENAPMCAAADDFFRFDSRITIARLLRAFLDEVGTSALELLCDYGNIRHLMRLENLYNQAVHRIASIQARHTETKPHERFDVLHAAVSELAERARENEDAPRFRDMLKAEGANAMVTAANAEFQDPYRAYVKHAAVAQLLSEQADWSGKIALVLDVIERGATGEGLMLLDQAVAEIMDGSEAVQAILGGQADLASALRALVQVSYGTYKGAGGRGSCLPRLTAALGRFDLRFTRHILLGRVERGLRGVKMLTREDPKADRDAFVEIVKLLTGPGGLRGGAEMSEAVTLRGRVAFGAVEDGDLSAEDGVTRILEILPSRAARLGYLLDLGRTPFATKYATAVLKPLAAVVQELPNVAALLPQGSTREQQAAVVNDLKRRVEKSQLPAEWRILLARRLDKLLAGEAAPKEAPPPVPAAAPAPAPQAAADPRCAVGRKTFQPGDILFRQDEPGDEAYLITAGEVEIVVKNGSGEKLLSTTQRGDIIGEMALINNAPRLASARAKTPVVVTVIPQETFMARLDRLNEADPIMRRLIEMFADRLRKLVETRIR